MILECSTEQSLSTLIEFCFARRRERERAVTMVVPGCIVRKTPLGARQVVHVFFRLVFLSFFNHNTIQHVGVSQTRLLPSIYPSSPSPVHYHPSLRPSSTICRQARTMKTFTPEPRLKILNERLSTNTAEPSTLGKPFIKFTCKETWINNNLCVKFQGAGTSMARRIKDESRPLRNSREQKNICVKYKSKQSKTGTEERFYPDLVVMTQTPASSHHESGLTTASSIVTPEDIIIPGQRYYCKSIGITAKVHISEG
jgi:hypothetical protein